MEDSKYVNRSEDYEIDYVLSSNGKRETENNRKIFLEEVNKELGKDIKLLRTVANEIIKKLNGKLESK